jgi:hypothetical protein
MEPLDPKMKRRRTERTNHSPTQTTTSLTSLLNPTILHQNPHLEQKRKPPLPLLPVLSPLRSRLKKS